jgi:hypothetical protein
MRANAAPRVASRGKATSNEPACRQRSTNTSLDGAKASSPGRQERGGSGRQCAWKMHDSPRRCLSRPTPAKTPDSLVALAVELVHPQLGIDLLLTLRQPNLRGWDDSSRDRAVTHAGRKDSKNRLSEAFLRRSVRTCAHQSRKEQIRASAPGDISRPPTGPQVLATRISPDRIASRDCHTQSFAVVAPASRSQLEMWHSFIASTPRR